MGSLFFEPKYSRNIKISHSLYLHYEFDVHKKSSLLSRLANQLLRLSRQPNRPSFIP